MGDYTYFKVWFSSGKSKSYKDAKAIKSDLTYGDFDSGTVSCVSVVVGAVVVGNVEVDLMKDALYEKK